MRYGNEHILVMINTFPKYVKLYPLRKATCDAAVKKMDEFIAQVGKPQKVFADTGTQFTSKRWSVALREINIKIMFLQHPP